MQRKLKAKIVITKKAMGPPTLAVYFFIFCKFYLGLMQSNELSQTRSKSQRRWGDILAVT